MFFSVALLHHVALNVTQKNYYVIIHEPENTLHSRIRTTEIFYGIRSFKKRTQLLMTPSHSTSLVSYRHSCS